MIQLAKYFKYLFLVVLILLCIVAYIILLIRFGLTAVPVSLSLESIGSLGDGPGVTECCVYSFRLNLLGYVMILLPILMGSIAAWIASLNSNKLENHNQL